MANIDANTAGEYAPTGPDGATLCPVFAYTGAASAADVIRLVKVEKNTVCTDVQVISDTANTGLNVDVGFVSVSGDSSDPDALIDGGVLATASRIRANTDTAPVALTEDSYLAVTVSAAVDAGTTITVIPTLTFNGHA